MDVYVGIQTDESCYFIHTKVLINAGEPPAKRKQEEMVSF
jgi:hypothetical protein